MNVGSTSYRRRFASFVTPLVLLPMMSAASSLALAQTAPPSASAPPPSKAPPAPPDSGVPVDTPSPPSAEPTAAPPSDSTSAPDASLPRGPELDATAPALPAQPVSPQPVAPARSIATPSKDVEPLPAPEGAPTPPSIEATSRGDASTPKARASQATPQPSNGSSVISQEPALIDSADADVFRSPDVDSVQVTVDRRLRDVQRVPASVIAISGRELERAAIPSARELPAATPYVEVSDQQGNIEIFTRGLGDSDDRGLGDTSMATFVDGVYIPRARGFRPLFFDTERVEIALGPQTTLRGRAAFAGTTHVISRAPRLGEWSADGSVQVGSYSQRLARGAVNIPFGQRLALRMAVISERHDPFFQNAGGAPLIRGTEDVDRWAYRITGRWEPTDDVSVTVRFDDTREGGTGVAGTNYTEALLSGLRVSELPNARSNAFVGNQPSLAVDHWGVSGEMAVDLGAVGLEVLSSYRSLIYNQHTGHNRTNFPGARATTPNRYTDTVWQTRSESSLNEIRVSSAAPTRLAWMVGFYHFSEWQSVFFGQVNDRASNGYLGREFNIDDMPSGALAGYADTTTAITDTIRTIVGFRVTSEYREHHGIGGGFTLQCNAQALALAQAEDPGARCVPPGAPGFEDGLRYGTPGFGFSQTGRTDYRDGGSANTLDGSKDRIETFTNGVASWGAADNVAAYLEQPGADVGTEFLEQHGKLTTLLPDFRLGAEWDLTQQSLMYLTLTSGHRRGGFNERLAANAAERLETYGPSTLYATELGSKNTLFHKRLNLNGAAFWYAQRDAQVATALPTGPSVGSVRSNVGHSRVLGFSVDALGSLSYGFSGKASATLLDARYLDGTIPNSNSDGDAAFDVSGNLLPRAPRLAFGYGVSQVVPTSIGDFDWSVSGQTKSSMYMTSRNGSSGEDSADQDPSLEDVVPWTTRVDASIGYAQSDGNIRVDAFVANLTNATYMTSLLAEAGTNLRFLNTPRQIGLRVSMSL